MNPDKEFFKMLRPLYFLSCIFCIRKYSFCRDTVTPITFKEIAVTLCANSIMIYLFYTTFQVTDFKVLSLKVYYFVIYGHHLFTFLVISCYNMGLSKTYVALILTLQKIYWFERHLHSSKSMQKKLQVSCGILMYVYIGVIIPKLVLDPFWNYARAIFLGLTIVIDLELVFIIFVIRLLTLKMEAWSKVAQDLVCEMNKKKRNNDMNIESRISVQDLENMTEQDQNIVIEEDQEIEIDNSSEAQQLFVVFNQLVDGINLMKTAFQFTIFFHALTLFTQSLVYIGVLIMWIKQAEYNMDVEKKVLISHSTGIIMWIAKALILQAVLGRASEELYTAACAARAVASQLMARRHNLATTRYAKNVLRLSTTLLSRFNAVGALPVDASLPLRLAALVTSYTVVLLQFALL